VADWAKGEDGVLLIKHEKVGESLIQTAYRRRVMTEKKSDGPMPLRGKFILELDEGVYY